jgi:hypothetical protein
MSEKHCPTCICGKRAPVQADRKKGPGTITWEEYLLAYSDYARQVGTRQSAEQLVERGGLYYGELVEHLGFEPKTWEPRR